MISHRITGKAAAQLLTSPWRRLAQPDGKTGKKKLYLWQEGDLRGTQELEVHMLSDLFLQLRGRG